MVIGIQIYGYRYTFFLDVPFLQKTDILIREQLGRRQMDEQEKSAPNTVVVQSNRFLDSPKNLTLNEYKLFMFVVSKINPDGNEIEKIRVTADEFANVLGAEKKNNIYKELKVASDRLLNRIITVHYPEKQLFTKTHLIASINYWYGKGYVDIAISPDMKPHLLKLKENFTQYKLSNIARLSSIYAIRIYELLKKQEVLGQRTFFLEDLRNKLGLSPETLQTFKNFRVRVLKTAQEEINEKTDIEISYTYQKTGRKVTAIIFSIQSKNAYREQNKQLYLDHKNDEDKNNLINEIVKLGYTEQQARELISKDESKHIQEAVLAVKEQMEKGNAQNPKAMLQAAIKGKWTDQETSNSGKKTKKTAGNAVHQPTPKRRHSSGLSKLFSVFLGRK